MMVEKELRGNQDHPGISMVIPLILLAAIVAFYFLLYRLVPFGLGGEPIEYIVVNGILAVVLGLVFIAAADPILKRIWPSGYVIELAGQRLSYQTPKDTSQSINLEEPYKLTCWFFDMAGYVRFGRERQIKRGSSCYACQVQQGDGRLVVHTFVSPSRLGQTFDLPGRDLFVELNMDEIYDTSLTGRFQQWRAPSSRPEIPSSLVVSERGRYWLAERSRWTNGIELQPRDFKQFLSHLLHYQEQATV